MNFLVKLEKEDIIVRMKHTLKFVYFYPFEQSLQKLLGG